MKTLDRFSKTELLTKISLFEYLGYSVAGTSLPLEVMQAAKAQAINIEFKPLPYDKHRLNYKSVAIYPIKFLDDYFSDRPETPVIVKRHEFESLQDRVSKLESVNNILIKRVTLLLGLFTKNNKQKQ